MYLEQFALIVDDYDQAIRFFVDVLGFELIEDSPSVTNDGRPKRWVVVRPPGATTALLLAQADGAHQSRAVGISSRDASGCSCGSRTSRRLTRG
jgi:catechol 2,3-dioxygenase-like lactoylglutathione lyase family enzyme